MSGRAIKSSRERGESARRRSDVKRLGREVMRALTFPSDGPSLRRYDLAMPNSVWNKGAIPGPRRAYRGGALFAARDITGLRDRLAGSASRAELITDAQLRAARLLRAGLPMRAASGGLIAAAAWLPGTGAAERRIVVVAWSRAAPGDRARPVGEPGTAHAGRLAAHAVRQLPFAAAGWTGIPPI